MAKPDRYCAATLVALLLWTASASAEDAATLQGAAAWQKLVGNTVAAGTKAGNYTEFYAPDGSLRRVDADGPTSGRWEQQGDGICFDYPDDDDHVCLHVTVQGTAGSFTDPDGTVDTFQILPGNAKNL